MMGSAVVKLTNSTLLLRLGPSVETGIEPWTMDQQIDNSKSEIAKKFKLSKMMVDFWQLSRNSFCRANWGVGILDFRF